MGTDLVSACIFCAGLFLGSELAPRKGLAVDIGFSYATLARRYDVIDVTPPRVDGSDATPKFVLIGMGNARPAEGSLGAGTAVSEWRVRVAFAPSHDEQERKATVDLPALRTTGTGRYENYEVLGRLAVTSTDSVEVIAGRRNHNATDLLNLGGSEHSLSEQRTLTAGRVDIAGGWRHRWNGLEAAAAVRWVKPDAYYATAGTFRSEDGSLVGGAAELRGRSGPWMISLSGERMSGLLQVHEESQPSFASQDFPADAAFTAARLGVAYSWPRTDLQFSATYDRQRLPFVSLAVLGTETLLFDDGYHPDSDNREVFWELDFRHAFTPAIRAKVGVRLGYGNETVRLTDVGAGRPPLTLDVRRRGVYGGGLSSSLGFGEPTLFIGADFAVGSGGN